jgi:hypothetical protein
MGVWSSAISFILSCPFYDSCALQGVIFDIIVLLFCYRTSCLFLDHSDTISVLHCPDTASKRTLKMESMIPCYPSEIRRPPNISSLQRMSNHRSKCAHSHSVTPATDVRAEKVGFNLLSTLRVYNITQPLQCGMWIRSTLATKYLPHRSHLSNSPSHSHKLTPTSPERSARRPVSYAESRFMTTIPSSPDPSGGRGRTRLPGYVIFTDKRPTSSQEQIIKIRLVDYKLYTSHSTQLNV